MLRDHGCSKEEIDRAGDLLFALEWAADHGELTEDRPGWLKIRPGALHRSWRFKNDPASRVETCLEDLGSGIGWDEFEQTAGRPARVVYLCRELASNLTAENRRILLNDFLIRLDKLRRQSTAPQGDNCHA
jgi:hypothetical protein